MLVNIPHVGLLAIELPYLMLYFSFRTYLKLFLSDPAPAGGSQRDPAPILEFVGISTPMACKRRSTDGVVGVSTPTIKSANGCDYEIDKEVLNSCKYEFCYVEKSLTLEPLNGFLFIEGHWKGRLCLPT